MRRGRETARGCTAGCQARAHWRSCTSVVPSSHPRTAACRTRADTESRLARTSRCVRRSSCLVIARRSEEHTSELQSLTNLVCRLLLEKKKKTRNRPSSNCKAGSFQKHHKKMREGAIRQTPVRTMTRSQDLCRVSRKPPDPLFLDADATDVVRLIIC